MVAGVDLQLREARTAPLYLLQQQPDAVLIWHPGAYNTGVLGNEPNKGGYEIFDQLDREKSTMATARTTATTEARTGQTTASSLPMRSL